MSKKKACKKCKIFVDGDECPLCKGNQFVLNWKGRLNITDAQRSDIAKKIGVNVQGEYAIKVT
ncbi:DNA-directed RNA polymerase subunit E'' [Candidatus Woesearchaeota archaeon]|nr:DNA-directed RNA polymerase subunit E'' [Candidatus Woesearchaeota archaeon]